MPLLLPPSPPAPEAWRRPMVVHGDYSAGRDMEGVNMQERYGFYRVYESAVREILSARGAGGGGGAQLIGLDREQGVAVVPSVDVIPATPDPAGEVGSESTCYDTVEEDEGETTCYNSDEEDNSDEADEEDADEESEDGYLRPGWRSMSDRLSTTAQKDEDSEGEEGVSISGYIESDEESSEEEYTNEGEDGGEQQGGNDERQEEEEDGGVKTTHEELEEQEERGEGVKLGSNWWLSH
ncbi:hypothetical protein TWF696_000595 [Orbilia brochopaga]|uniref:Uncharacterized protein n=1 Tax=Orbilia brochopaga TaxID=3140254 RepID=A0AAV9VBU9_9PEZI